MGAVLFVVLLFVFVVVCLFALLDQKLLTSGISTEFF